MGTSRRAQPARLAAKLLQIRQRLGLTQEQMVKRLGRTKTPIYVGHISGFEASKREPSLLVLLRYAKVAGISTDVLIDDDLNLPDHLPPVMEAEGIMKRKRASGHRS
jgi:transcriptional regulator with XRE-family HTH domain